MSVERFWSKVDRSGGPDACWPWTASTAHYGYGQFWAGDLLDKSERPPHGRVLSHKVALLLSGEPRPDGAHCLHSCDNPSCCNPKHLRWGTHAENMQDAEDRGRAQGARGETNAKAKLTESDVKSIRERFTAGESQVHMHAEYGVSRNVISSAIRGKTWAHVGGAVPGGRKHTPRLAASTLSELRRTSPIAKMTQADVEELRKLYASGSSVEELAARYQINHAYCSRIARGKARVG